MEDVPFSSASCHHPASRYRAGNGAIFSSSKAPPGPGLESSCELPFGFLWTPLSPPDNNGNAVAVVHIPNIKDNEDKSSSSVSSLPAGVVCLTCLAYLNLYARFDEETGRWTCPLCGATNVAPKESFQTISSNDDTVEEGGISPLLVQPFVEFRQELVVPRTKTGDVMDTCSIVLVMDENLPREEAQAVGTSIQTILLEMANEVAMNCRLDVGLIVFGKNVSIYRLGNAATSGMASADVFATHDGLVEDLINTRSYMATVQSNNSSGNSSSSLQGLWRCLAAVYGILLPDISGDDADENVVPPLSRLDRLRQRKQVRLQQHKQQQTGTTSSANGVHPSSGTAKSPWTHAREKATTNGSHNTYHHHQHHHHRQYRCTGEAIQCAIDLATVDPVQPSRTGRILLFTDGCPNYGDGSVVVSTEQTDDTRTRIRNQTTLHHHYSKSSRRPDVVDATKLVRSVQFLGVVAKAASEVGVAFDVLCTGPHELALPAYQALVEPSSGYVLPHLSFTTTQQLECNLDFLLKHTFVSGLHFSNNDYSSMYGNHTNNNVQHRPPPLRDDKWVDGCIVDFRMPSFMTPTHFVGPGELLDDSRSLLANERSAFAAGASLAAKNKMTTNNLPSRDIVESTMTRLRMGRHDPISSFSVMLQVNEFFQRESHALFQCVVRYVDRGGTTLVTRVFTHRLSIAKDRGEFLDAVDEEVVPVLLGKEAAYRAMFGRETKVFGETEPLDAIELDGLAYDAQRDLDATIQRISGAFRLLGLEHGTSRRGLDLTEEGGVMAAGSSIDFAFPPELADALHRLYHFRRGPILSPGPVAAMDDRAEIRSLFLRLPLEDCLSMMALSLWSAGPLTVPGVSSPATTVPPDTLALWDNCILAGDHYFALFLWSGRSTLDEGYDAIRNDLKDFLLRRSQNRFPMPTLHVLSENDSMSRRFTSLLAPSHVDPVEHQLANFPALGSLSPSELTALQSKFKFYDPETDASFRNWFWRVSSATSACKEEGVSLCD